MRERKKELTIGTLAKQAGVGVETVRYYQRRGLLREPERTYGSIRRYGESDLGRLSFIRSAKALGFSLDEVSELLRLADGMDCNEAREVGEKRLADVRAKITGLERIEKTLSALVRKCRRHSDNVSCPLIESLNSGADDRC